MTLCRTWSCGLDMTDADLHFPIVALVLIIADGCDGALRERNAAVVRPCRPAHFHTHAVRDEEACLHLVLHITERRLV